MKKELEEDGFMLVKKKKKTNEHQKNYSTDKNEETLLPANTMNQNSKKYVLCINTNPNCNCQYSHHLEEWTPRSCHYESSCYKKDKCPYYHTNESKMNYLKRLFTIEDTFYYKNKQKFTKLYI